MDLSINTNLYSAMGVDVNNVENVANKILSQSANKVQKEPVVKSIDYSKFNRNTLGINLYSSRTNVELQKQVSQISAGLYAKSIDVSQLNSLAAQSLYSAVNVQKNVELAQSIQQNELIAPQRIEKEQTTVELFNIFDENSSSNGFNPFEEKEDNKDNNKDNK